PLVPGTFLGDAHMTTDRKRARRASLCALLLAGTALLGAGGASLADPRDGDAVDRRDNDRGEDGDRDFRLEHGSLVISSSTYDRTKGAVAALAIGTTLPDSATATTKAITGNSYVTVWNNESVDASFGVTSPIDLADVDAESGRVMHRLRVPV